MSRPGVGGPAPDLGRYHMGGSGNEMPNTHTIDTFTSAQLPLTGLRPPLQDSSHVNGTIQTSLRVRNNRSEVVQKVQNEEFAGIEEM